MSILDYFILILIVVFSLLPIIFWGFLFSYFDNDNSNRLKFFIGIVSGVVSTLPVLFLPKLFDSGFFDSLNIFQSISLFNGGGDIWSLFISSYFVIFLLSIVSFFILNIYFTKKKFIDYFKSLLVFLVFSFLFTLVVYLIYLLFLLFGGINRDISSQISFGEIVFNSLLLVVFYYLIIGLIEELSKFFCFKYSKGLDIRDKNQIILYGVFVALGFSFLENILYFRSIFENGGFTKEFIGVYFSRNIFSVFLHVICTTIFVYFFYLGINKFKNIINFGFLKIISIGFLISVLLHAFFDIMLTLGFGFIVILYLIGGYFYITSLFYKD